MVMQEHRSMHSAAHAEAIPAQPLNSWDPSGSFVSLMNLTTLSTDQAPCRTEVVLIFPVNVALSNSDKLRGS